jgi:hypothetical protein
MFQKELYNFGIVYTLIRGHVTVQVISIGNAECFTKSLAMVFQIVMIGECYENVYT